MSWSKFFYSRPFKYAAVSGGVGLIVGSAASLACAFYFSEACSQALTKLEAAVGPTINIPELDANIPIRNYTVTINLKNIAFDVPQDFFDLLNNVSEEAADYCFKIPLILAMCLTILGSLALGSSAFSMGLYQQQKENEEQLSQYSLITCGTSDSV